MLSILSVRLTIKVKVGIQESFKVGWYRPKKTGSSHLKAVNIFSTCKSTAVKQSESALNADLAMDRSTHHAQRVFLTV